MEKWKKILGFENYEVSSFGNIRSIKSGNILKGGKDRNGYKCVNLRSCNKTYFRPIHRLVAITFLKIDKEKKCVNHIDSNKENNKIENLEFCNYYENNTHMKLKSGKTSKYAGVSYCKNRKKYSSSIRVNGNNCFLGRYENEIDAYNAYLNALKKYNIKNKYA